MGTTELGQAALFGWREKVADALAGPLTRRSPLSEDQVRAILGAAFFAVSVYYVGETLRRAAAER